MFNSNQIKSELFYLKWNNLSQDTTVPISMKNLLIELRNEEKHIKWKQIKIINIRSA